MTQSRRKHFEKVKGVETQSQTPLREAGPASPGQADAGVFADLAGAGGGADETALGRWKAFILSVKDEARSPNEIKFRKGGREFEE